MPQTIEKLPDGFAILFDERVTFRDHDALSDALALFEGARGLRCVFDLSGTEFVDSAALGLFLVARDKAEENGVSLSLRGCRGKVRDVLEVSRFDDLFEIED